MSIHNKFTFDRFKFIFVSESVRHYFFAHGQQSPSPRYIVKIQDFCGSTYR